MRIGVITGAVLGLSLIGAGGAAAQQGQPLGEPADTAAPPAWQSSDTDRAMEQARREMERNQREMEREQREMERGRAQVERERERMAREQERMHEQIERMRRQMAEDAAHNAYVYRYSVNRPCARMGFSFDGTDTLTVRNVDTGSPAEGAGMRAGDVIVAVNGHPARTDSMVALSRRLRPGDDVRLTLRQAGRTRTVTVTAHESTCELGQTLSRYRLWQDCPRDLARRDSAKLTDEEREELAACDEVRWNVVAPRLAELPRMMDRIRVWAADSAGGWGFSFDSLAADSLYFDLDSVRIFTDQAMMYADSAMKGLPVIIAMQDSLAHILREADLGGHLADLRAEMADAQRAHGLLVRSLEIGNRAVAGAELTEMNPSLADYFDTDHGVLITDVAPGSPAGNAGLRAGDVITAVGGRRVEDVGDLRAEIERAAAQDQAARIEVVRKGKRLDLTLPKP